MGNIGFGELLLVALVAVLVWGGKLPEVMRKAGKTYSSLIHTIGNIKSSINEEMEKATKEDLEKKSSELPSLRDKGVDKKNL